MSWNNVIPVWILEVEGLQKKRNNGEITIAEYNTAILDSKDIPEHNKIAFLHA